MADQPTCAVCGKPCPVGATPGLCSTCATAQSQLAAPTVDWEATDAPTDEGSTQRGPFNADTSHSGVDASETERTIDFEAPRGGGGGDETIDPDSQTRFGDYEILEEVARGGMGVVFRARQLSLNRPVALKMIRSGEMADEDEVRRFHIEAEAAANLDHPAIVPIYEVGLHEGKHFYSMGFVDGRSLSQVIQQGPLPPRQAARLLQIIADAMHYAHGQGVIHRDLKPGNILLVETGEEHGSSTASKTSWNSSRSTRRGPGAADLDVQSKYFPRITDFGLAKQTRAESELTTTGQILGTPSYMPPEQAAGRSEIGPAADIYSLGAVLYAMLAGRPPFQAANVLETIKQVADQEPVSLTRLNHSIDRDLDNICLKCLQKNPDRRYETAADLAADLQRYLDGEPVKARAIGNLERFWRWCRRKPAAASSLLAGSAAILMLIVLALVSSQLRLSREKAKRLEKDQELKQTQLEAANALAKTQKRMADTQEYYALLSGVRERASDPKLGWAYQGIDELKRAAALDVRGDLQTLRNEAARCLMGVDLKVLAKIPVPLGHRSHRVAFDQLGKRLALATQKNRLQLHLVVCDVPSGKLTHRLSVPPAVPLSLDGFRHITFLSNGRELAATTRGGWLHRWDLSDSNPQRISVKMPVGEATVLSFDPRASRAFFSADGQIHEWPDLTKSDAEGFAAGDSISLAVSTNGRWLATGGYGRVEVFDARRKHPLHRFESGGVRLCFEPSGQLLATASEESMSTLDMVSGRTQHVIVDPRIGALHEGDVRNVAFSPNGDLLVTGGGDQKMKLWDAANGKLLLSVFLGGDDEIFPVFGPQGKYLATTGDRQAILYEINGPEIVSSVAPHADAIRSFHVSRQPEVLACSATDPAKGFAVSLWSMADGSLRDRWTVERTGDGSRDEMTIRIRDDASLVAVSNINSIYAWELKEAARSATGPAARAGEASADSAWELANLSLVFDGDGFRRVASWCPDATRTRLDDSIADWGSVDAALNGDGGKAYLFRRDEFVVFDPMANRIAAGDPRKIADHWPGIWPRDLDAAMLGQNGKAYFFKGEEYIRFDLSKRRADKGYPKKIARYFPGVFTSDLDAILDYSPRAGGAWFLKGGQAVLYVDRKSQKGPMPLEDAFESLSSDRVIEAAIDMNYRSAPHWLTAGVVERGGKKPGPLALAPDGETLWAASSEELVSWSLPQLEPKSRWSNQLIGKLVGVATISCVDAGKGWVVAGTKSGALNVFSERDAKLRGALQVKGPHSTVVSRAGTLAACGTTEGKVIVVRLPSGRAAPEVIARIDAHGDVVTSLAFTHDDQLLASASRDKTIRLWQRRQGVYQSALTIRTPGTANAIQFLGEGDGLLGLVQGEKSLRVWRLKRLRERLAELGLNW